MAVKKNEQLNDMETKEGYLPWLNDVKQHRVCDSLPYFERIRTSELGYPDRIKVIQHIWIPA